MPAAKLYDPAKFLPEIHAWIESGKTLRAYCRQDGKPSYSIAYDWLEADVEQATRFGRARKLGEKVLSEECLEIADNTQIGEIVTQKADGSVEIKTADMIEHRKLRIETRLKLLAKWNPKEWGDRTTLAGDPDAPLVLSQRLQNADKRLKAKRSGSNS